MHPDFYFFSIFCWVSISVSAQIPNSNGEQFQVNTYSTEEQYRPSVSFDDSGGYVIVWESDGSNGTDSSGWSVLGQRFSSNGTAIGSEFQVNTYTTDKQYRPTVSFDPTGGFVVVWASRGSLGTDSDSFSVLGQRFGSDGSSKGSEFQVNTFTTGNQMDASVSPYGAGSFVVVWDSWGSGALHSIQGQRFDSSGNAVGSEFAVNSGRFDSTYYPSVRPNGDGGFVVVWTTYGSGIGLEVLGQRFDSDGSANGTEFQVNSRTTGDQLRAAVSSHAGGFIVVWEDEQYIEESDIRGQRFESNGMPLSEEFQINTYTTGYQRYPVVSQGSDGFIVTWDNDGSSGSDSSSRSVQGRRFSSNGSAIGSEFQVNTYTTSNQRRSTLVHDGNDGFVVVWQSYGSFGDDTWLSSIQAQIYSLPDLFADGFESGDLAAWSNSQP